MKTFKSMFRLLGISLFVILTVAFCLNSALAVEKNEVPEEGRVEKRLKKGVELPEVSHKNIRVDSERGKAERGVVDIVRDFFGVADDRRIGPEDRQAIKREFKSDLGREMTADEEKQIFDREDDGKYHGSNHDYAVEIAGREHERAAREYYGRDTSREIDYDREAAERELEANSREREYGREIPERASSKETDYDREAAERERQANRMEGY